MHVDTRPDDGTGRTARTVCNCGAWGSDWATPVEAFEAGAAHTAAEQRTTGRDEWPAEDLRAELDELRRQRIDRGLPVLPPDGAS